MEHLSQENKDNSRPYDGSDQFIDTSSMEMFRMSLPRVIRSERDKQNLIDQLKRMDYDTNGNRRDYFHSLIQEVEKFEIK